MVLNKWNYKTHKYDKYEVPNDWKCTTYCDDINEIVNCPECGKKVTFGDCYASLEIHTNVGFGYAVCEKCYEDELERKKKCKK